MKTKLLSISAAVAFLAISGQVNADLDLAKKSGCMACHSIEKKIVGPSWKDVAKRYKGKADAKAMLITKVKKGGKGAWTKLTKGAPMPPYSPRVSDANIEKLIDFVLSI